MNIPVYQEYLEGEDPEQDIQELNNISNKKQIYSNSSGLFKLKSTNLEERYEDIIEKYEKKFSQKKSENINEEYDKKFQKKSTNESPLLTFDKLQKEVELIEKDLEYYKSNKDSYKSVASIEDSMEELNKLKYIISYINSSNNFEKLKKIDQNLQKNGIKMDEENYNLLNKKIYNNLEEQLSQRLNNIKKLKAENPINYENIEFELFLNPDNEKMKQFKELDEIVLKINEIEKKIGKWNFNNKKNTINSMLELIKSNYIFFDKATKNEIVKKFDNANLKLDEIRENYKDTYDKIEEDKINDLTAEGIEAKEAEKIINDTIYKMELMEDEHEQSIFISQKVKDLIKKNEELKEKIEEDTLMLEQLRENVENNVNTMKKNIEVIRQKL